PIPPIRAFAVVDAATAPTIVAAANAIMTLRTMVFPPFAQAPTPSAHRASSMNVGSQESSWRAWRSLAATTLSTDDPVSRVASTLWVGSLPVELSLPDAAASNNRNDGNTGGSAINNRARLFK